MRTAPHISDVLYNLSTTAAGLAQWVECLIAEWVVEGLIPGAGPTLRVLR